MSWLNLKVMNNAEKVVMNTTVAQLKAMPAFTYPQNHRPGDVYRSGALRDRSEPTTHVAGTGASTPPGNR